MPSPFQRLVVTCSMLLAAAPSATNSVLAGDMRAGGPGAASPTQAVRGLIHSYYYGPQGQLMRVPARFASCSPMMGRRFAACPVTPRFFHRLQHPDPRPAGCLGGCTLDPVSRSQNTTQRLSIRLVDNNESAAHVNTRWGYTYNTLRLTFVVRHWARGWLVDDEYCTGHPATTIYKVPIKACP